MRTLTPTLAGESLIARVMRMDALIEQSAQGDRGASQPVVITQTKGLARSGPHRRRDGRSGWPSSSSRIVADDEQPTGNRPSSRERRASMPQVLNPHPHPRADSSE